MTELALDLYILALIGNFLCLYIPETTLLTKPFTKKTHILYIILLFISCLFYVTYNLNGTACILLSFLWIGLLTDKHLYNTILAIWGYLTSMCWNYIFLLIFDKITGIDQSMLYTTAKYQIIFYLFYIPSLYLVLFIIKKLLHLIPSMDKAFKKSLLLFIIAFLLICVLIYRLNATIEYDYDFPDELVRRNAMLFIGFFIFTGILLLVVIITIYKDIKTSQSLKEMENLKKYTEEIENLYFSLRSFKHDYTNVLYSMKSYIDTKQYDSLNTYYENDILPLVKSLDTNNPAIEFLSNIKIPELKSILYLKILEAGKEKIQVNLEVKWSIDEINIKPIDLTRIMGNILDNAIDEAKEISDKKKRVINISCINNKKATVIIINNPTIQQSINLADIRKTGSTTKSGEHGLGLSNVTSIIKRYPNCLLETEFEDGIFTQTIEIS